MSHYSMDLLFLSFSFHLLPEPRSEAQEGQELQQKLARMGLDVSEEHFYTSALATATFLKEQAPGCSVYAIGEAGLFNALYDNGITMNDVNQYMQMFNMTNATFL